MTDFIFCDKKVIIIIDYNRQFIYERVGLLMEEIIKCMAMAKTILKQNAGVMDTTGRIFASTDPMLQDQVDSSVRGVMNSEDVFLFTADRTYMKVYVGENLKYILFMEGDDPGLRTNLGLLAEWIKAASKERGSEQDKELFTKNVLLENVLPGEISMKAREFKINYAIPRLVMLVATSEEDEMEALDVLQNLYENPDVATVLSMDEKSVIIVFNAQDAIETEDTKNTFIDNTAGSILECLNAEGIKAHIGVGSYVNQFQYISKSYIDAKVAQRVGSIFDAASYISRYDQLGLGRMIYQLPERVCEMFIDEVFPNNAYRSLDDDTLETINTFFNNNLNGSETSRELYVHRNTLVYRLDKVKKNTGLDLRSFDDAVLFKMASMVKTYLDYLKESKDNKIR